MIFLHKNREAINPSLSHSRQEKNKPSSALKPTKAVTGADSIEQTEALILSYSKHAASNNNVLCKRSHRKKRSGLSVAVICQMNVIRSTFLADLCQRVYASQDSLTIFLQDRLSSET